MASSQTDRRVARTRGLLHDALASLIHEKGYDAIVVKEILVRANVGRSTFYAHFRDKDELLDSGIREMVSTERPTAVNAGIADRVVRFSLPLLEHIARLRGPRGLVPLGERQRVVHERLRRIVAELVADDLRRSGTRIGGALPADLLALHVATTFVTSLEWWIRSGGAEPPRTVDARFRALVVPALAALLGEPQPPVTASALGATSPR